MIRIHEAHVRFCIVLSCGNVEVSERAQDRQRQRGQSERDGNCEAPEGCCKMRLSFPSSDQNIQTLNFHLH